MFFSSSNSDKNILKQYISSQKRLTDEQKILLGYIDNIEYTIYIKHKYYLTSSADDLIYLRRHIINNTYKLLPKNGSRESNALFSSIAREIADNYGDLFQNNELDCFNLLAEKIKKLNS